MRKARFTDEQMVAIIREADREPVPAVAKRHGISEQTIYTWRKRFGGFQADDDPATEAARGRECTAEEAGWRQVNLSVTPKLTGHSTPSANPVTITCSDRLMRTSVCGRKKPPPTLQALGIRCPGDARVQGTCLV